MFRRARRQSGVSLIEAMVAFAIMAFGMLAVVGMQATLRTNGDLSRQRAEAVRLAQDAIEEWRGFTVHDDPTYGRTAYSHIVTVIPDETVSSTELPAALSNGWTSTPLNTTYTIHRQVNPEPVVNNATTADRKTLVVTVSWVDRNSETQSVRLGTSVAWSDPVLEASTILTSNLDTIYQPGSRNRAIPPGAKNIGDNRSGWIPPGQTAVDGHYVAWRFDNTTGVIALCTVSVGTTAQLTAANLGSDVCSDAYLLVSGFVRYDGTQPPTVSSAANPSSPYIPAPKIAVSVDSTRYCFQDSETYAGVAIAYYCAVRVYAASTPPSTWTGNIVFSNSDPGPLQVVIATAATLPADLPSQFKVCRYAGVPMNYTAQATALMNQNFLLITAGDSVHLYPCPNSNPALPLDTPVADFQPIVTP